MPLPKVNGKWLLVIGCSVVADGNFCYLLGEKLIENGYWLLVDWRWLIDIFTKS
jgi:hypothetical protein